MVDGVEKVAEGPKKEEDGGMQKHVNPIHEAPHMENFESFIQICSDLPTHVWSGLDIGKILVFITPLQDESTSNHAHHAQEEADKQHDIDVNSATTSGKLHLTCSYFLSLLILLSCSR